MKKITIKKERTHRPITLTLKLTTIDRLEKEVSRGSWSKLTDLAINAFLNGYHRR